MPDTGATGPGSRFLFVAGMPKSGTTSVFAYLAAHPDVVAGRPKEPFYFMPPDYPVPSALRWNKDPPEAYYALFPPAPQSSLRVEASSLYYSMPGIARRIRNLLPDSRALLLLRDPIARLISGYQMADFEGWLPRDMTADQFARRMLEAAEHDDESPLFRHGLRQGLCAAAIAEWREVFGPARFEVFLFDDLARAPAAVMERVAGLAGLDPAFYKTYEFTPKNASRARRNAWLREPYLRLRQGLQRRFPPGHPLRTSLAAANRPLHPLIERLTTRRIAATPLAPATERALRNFYAADVKAVERLLGRPVPWRDRYGA